MSTIELRPHEASVPAPTAGVGRVRTSSDAADAISAAWGWILTIGLGLFAVTLIFSRYLFWDSYLDLGAGRYIAAHGIPHHEVFTIEGVGRPWIDQQWLAHWIYYQSWALGGYPLVAIVSSALVAVGFMALGALMISRSVPPQRALLWATIAYVACMGNTVIRAQSFAYPLLVIVFWALVTASERNGFPTWLPLLVPLLAIWSNLHGTVALAIVLVTTFAAWRALAAAYSRSPRVALLYGAMAAVTPLTLFANPYGFGVLDYYSALVRNPVIRRYIVEWGPPSPDNLFSVGFFVLALLVVCTAVYGFVRGSRPSAVQLGISAILLTAAVQGVRYQAWFALAGALLAAETLARTRPEPEKLTRRVRLAGAACVAGFAVVTLFVVVRTPDSQFERLVSTDALKAATTYATEHPQARVLTDDVNSSALLWLHPEMIGRVAFDARLEQYPQPRLRAWFEFVRGHADASSAPVRDYDVVVASKSANPQLVRRLRALRGWRVLEDDQDGVALVRPRS